PLVPRKSLRARPWKFSCPPVSLKNAQHGRRRPGRDETFPLLSPPGKTLLRILLIGATGFIGARLLARLLAKGHRVVAVSRKGRGPDHAALQRVALPLEEALDP